MCEKALADYLETKRMEFPRFFFISSADLLDILSKGNRPKEVLTEKRGLFFHLHYVLLESLCTATICLVCFTGFGPSIQII